MQDKLRKISDKPNLGGWKEAFGSNYSDGMFLKVKLWNKEPRIEGRHSLLKKGKVSLLFVIIQLQLCRLF